MKEFLKKILNKKCSNILLYGNSGCGKTYLFQSVFDFKTETLCFIDDVEFRENSSYLRFDARLLKQSKNVLNVINEIISTKNMKNEAKIIFFKNFNILHEDVKKKFRELIENNLHNAVFVFTTNNINTIDKAIISRCFLLNVKSDINYIKSITNDKYDKVMKITNDINIVKAIMDNYKITNEIIDLNQIISKKFLNEINECKNLTNLLKLSEKYVSFNLNFTKIFESMNLDLKDIVEYESSNQSFNDFFLIILKIFQNKNKKI